MSKTIKVALAGAGAFGIKHLDGIRNIDGVEVVSLISRDLEKTREVAAILKNLGVEKTALLVLAGPDDTITRASANIAGLKTVYVNTINVLDILGNEKFIITEEAVKLVEEVYA